MTMSKNCESCGMPMKNDKREGKAKLDPRYCSNCFIHGDFVVKNVSAAAFRDQVYVILQENGWQKPLAWIGTRHIPKLPRWKQENPDQI